jgi:hypothetical protein
LKPCSSIPPPWGSPWPPNFSTWDGALSEQQLNLSSSLLNLEKCLAYSRGHTKISCKGILYHNRKGGNYWYMQ